MPDSIDAELQAELKKALRKSRNYAIVAKGPLVLKVFVQKRPIKPGQLKQAKREFGGNVLLFGVCRGDGGNELVFEVEEKEPAIPPSRLRKFISEQAGLMLQPRFEVVET